MRQDPQTSAVLSVVKQFCRLEQEKGLRFETRLFGSWAYGAPGQDSDIDLAIIIDGDCDIDLEQRIWDDARSVDRRIETHVFSREAYHKARRALVYDIKEKGIEIRP